MPLLALFGAVLAFGYLFPRAAEKGAYLLTFGFIVPFFLFGGGAFAWSAVGIFTSWNLSYLTCCGLFGVPIAALFAHFILS